MSHGKGLTAAFSTLAMLACLSSQAHAAQCGNGAGGFEAWKQQFAGEARAKGVGGAGVAALQQTTYAGATIAADRSLHSFKLSLDQFLAKRGAPAIVARGRAMKQRNAALFASIEQRYGVPAGPLHALIQANRQDQQVTRYATYAELARYCELSANPVGQVVLYIFGAATPERIAASDSICTALQLAEHWQDVAEDLGMGRIYLPAEDLDRFGCTEADLAEPTAGPAVRRLMRFEVDRAAALLDAGAPLVGTLRGAARLSVAGYLGGGRAALAALRQHRYDVLNGTHKPRKPRLVAELLKTYVTGR